MIIRGPHINLFDLVSCFSEALDLISPAVSNHHKQVAYISCSVQEFFRCNNDVSLNPGSGGL